MKYTNPMQEATPEELGALLLSVNATIEKQIAQMQEDVNRFTDFLAQLKTENHQRNYCAGE